MSQKRFDLGTALLSIASFLTVITSAYCKPVVHVPQSLDTTPSLVTGKWTASDAPYKGVEKQIAEDYTDGRNMQDVLHQWQQESLKNPKDPVIRFAVVFASRGVAKIANPDAALPYSLVETLASHDPGNVHEYARMRFCMLEEADRPLPPNEAKAVGNKLLQYNPKDTLVRTNLIYMLCDDNHAKEALPYALEWAKAEPNNAKVHTSLALVYQDMWFATKNKQYGRLAVQEFQQFLQIAPPSDGFRANAKNSIKVLQREVAKAG